MIEVTNLVKRYGDVEAVRNVSFTVNQDQVLGFLGPNGAGKTTIMKILTGYHFPSSGTAFVEGFSLHENPVEAKTLTGYLPESVPLYVDMTVEEYLVFMAQARLIAGDKQKAAVEESVESCGLGAVRTKLIETLSKGYRQRVGLAQAIIHDPPILILDEPTSGLDPNQIIEIRSLIKELGKRKTVILSTHILQEVEAVCSRVLILNEGRIAAQGTSEEIALSLKGGDTWEILLKGSGIEEKITRLSADAKINPEIKGEATGVSFFQAAGKNALGGEQIFDWAVREQLKITGMNCKKLSLEDIFVKLTKEEGRKEGAQNTGGGE
ncbi:MAG: ATP-binding cassette domain-containing protein [Treponema sp.]|jgi:ABC-2 type transport system ATP-binding protein|nr:ATP-binding cassette domain-containing protein [Treponema sp.]